MSSKTVKHTQTVRRGIRDEPKEGGGYNRVDAPEFDHVDWKSEDTDKTYEEMYDESVSEFKDGHGGGILEVILTDKFLKNHEHGALWAKKLKEAGFKLVSRFLNKNSGNVCNVFHLYKVAVPEGNPPNWE
jgi:hypothetical protein